MSPLSRLQEQQLMTSQTRSSVECLIPTRNMLVLRLHANLNGRNVYSLVGGFQYDSTDELVVADILGPPCISINTK